MKHKLAAVLMIVVLLSGCLGCHNPIRENNLHNSNHSFVKFETMIGDTPIGWGSGFIVKSTPDGAFVMSAAHVCDIDPIAYSVASELGETVTQRVVSHKGGKTAFHTLVMNEKVDLCLGYSHGLHYPALEFATEPPLIGEKVISISAPRGITDPENGMMVVTEGVYSGIWKGHDSYTMDISFGSSGGVIVNTRGKIVGMTNGGLMFGDKDMYSNLAVGPVFKKMIQFVDKNLWLRDRGI